MIEGCSHKGDQLNGDEYFIESLYWYAPRYPRKPIKVKAWSQFSSAIMNYLFIYSKRQEMQMDGSQVSQVEFVQHQAMSKD